MRFSHRDRKYIGQSSDTVLVVVGDCDEGVVCRRFNAEWRRDAADTERVPDVGAGLIEFQRGPDGDVDGSWVGDDAFEVRWPTLIV
ncbi:MAG: hypothetical protein EAZ81_10120 [Verrucomicrobia bacterium]|nr:MAG: hypothetical protein EAZ81_10120 [Verrucomicrobiota bacterium]